MLDEGHSPRGDLTVEGWIRGYCVVLNLEKELASSMHGRPSQQSLLHSFLVSNVFYRSQSANCHQRKREANIQFYNFRSYVIFNHMDMNGFGGSSNNIISVKGFRTLKGTSCQ